MALVHINFFALGKFWVTSPGPCSCSSRFLFANQGNASELAICENSQRDFDLLYFDNRLHDAPCHSHNLRIELWTSAFTSELDVLLVLKEAAQICSISILPTSCFHNSRFLLTVYHFKVGIPSNPYQFPWWMTVHGPDSRDCLKQRCQALHILFCAVLAVPWLTEAHKYRHHMT